MTDDKLRLQKHPGYRIYSPVPVDAREYDALAAEIARLRALMTEMSKHRSSHIIEHSVFPSLEEYEAAKARDIHLGPTVTYTCGIHNISMSEHGDRCPECDRTADSARESAP